ncbi:hypothetical protein QTP70_017546 [Hemibagrus guttatus]|uniref:Tc1-like transposase DDE domain-containing protein n=1 Tax=Hemibagrus guttatus TaxID=175788 RepID=A0AAE0QL76_9TELE|nr:hypothetical protein QTP70_017546 [Hemibagrus guttatus]
MPRSKEIQKQMRKKVIEIYQSGKGYKAISKALGTAVNHSESHYLQMAKTWNSGEPSQEWPADQNYPTSVVTTYPGVKYGGGSVMVWGCFAASGHGRLAVINGTMNSAVYQNILKENVRPSVCDLKLKRTWVLQQDNDPKHTSKSTSEWLKKNKMKTLEWPSQSPDLNPIEMLWHDLKKVVHAQKPSNVAELQQFCKDEWAKIPPQRCNRLIASY